MWRLSPPLRVIHKLERRNSWRAWDSKVNSGKTRSQETARKVAIFDHAHSPTFSPIVLPTFEFVLSQKFAWNSKRAHWTVHFRAFALHGGRSTGTRTGLIWILKNSTFYFETVYKLPFICCSSCVPRLEPIDSVLTVYWQCISTECEVHRMNPSPLDQLRSCRLLPCDILLCAYQDKLIQRSSSKIKPPHGLSIEMQMNAAWALRTSRKIIQILSIQILYSEAIEFGIPSTARSSAVMKRASD